MEVFVGGFCLYHVISCMLLYLIVSNTSWFLHFALHLVLSDLCTDPSPLSLIIIQSKCSVILDEMGILTTLEILTINKTYVNLT